MAERTLKTDVHILAEGGMIAKRLPGYEPRPEQLEMARAVAAAFADEAHLLVEAGTGVGKSFAYLVPAIEHATQGKGRAVISTHTIALQEQLVEKDIPFLQSVLPKEFTAVLVKGRSNYLGLRRLERASARQANLLTSKKDIDELHRIEDWAYETQDGSLADLPFQPSPEIWDLARSDGDDCLGRRCPHFQRCFYQQARRRAGKAQILVVNHALLFSDLAVRQRGAAILPDYDYLVLDEAHTIERVAGEHLGISVTNTQGRYLLNRLYNERTRRGILNTAAGKRAIPVVEEARKTVDRYFGELVGWFAGLRNSNGRLRKPPPLEQPVSDALMMLHDELRQIREGLKDENERSEYGGLMQRCKDLADTLAAWHAQKNEDWVHWMDVRNAPRHRVTLAGRPLDVGPALKTLLFDKIKSVVLTSATLTTTTGDPFAYIQERLGLDEARTLLLGSPFDYQRQLKVYVEAGLPDPSNTTAFVPAACQAIEKYIRRTGGHAFVLFTSYAMLNQCAERMGDFFEREKMPLLVQGSGMPRSAMLNRFRSTPRSVLFGTETFWTGVDVPGDALTNVIIVKLPFAVPNEPVIEARIEKIRAEGGNPFMAYQVPEAILKFRQGIGRLIRSRTDHGIIAILDPRVTGKPYGKRFLAALPRCEVIVENGQA